MSEVKVFIATGFGLNCEKETSVAFEKAGAKSSQVFINDLLAQPEILLDYDILVFIGGFSFGDHLGSGIVLANKFKSISEVIKKFIIQDKLVLGICNGFQTMSILGLFSIHKELFEQEFALAHNDSKQFRNDWITVKANRNSPCIFTKGIDLLDLPIRHGEGKFIALNDKVMQSIVANNCIALQYVDNNGKPTQDFPFNPNGSHNAIAGICDKTGRIFGLMPHPEAFISPFNHPQWLEQKSNGVLPEEGLGMKIFHNAVEYFQQ